MLRRTLCPVRPRWAASLLTLTLLGGTSFVLASDPGPAPGPETTPQTVEILQAKKAGDIAVTVRGHGEDHVKVAIKNNSTRRLNIVLPPGLVAACGTGQAGGGGGGFQSMGLGTPTSNAGRFGQFRAQAEATEGFRSIPVSADAPAGVTVSAGQSIEFALPSVCLNFGLPTPTYQNQFRLMDVNEYSPDVRVQRALRSLATLGTSQTVAQAVMWNVCNGMTLEQLGGQVVRKFNPHELTLAARFLEALNGASGDIIDPAYLTQNRLYIRVGGDGLMAKDAKRLHSELSSARILGLPAQVLDDDSAPNHVGSLELRVVLTSSKPNQTQGRILVRHCSYGEGWVNFGQVTFKSDSPVGSMSGPALAEAIDHAVSSAFVTAHIARRGTGVTTLKVENRLPFTVANVTLRAGRSAEASKVTMTGLGIGPAHATLVPIQASNGVVDRVELNGL